MSLVEYLLLTITLLLAVIAFNTLKEPTRSQLGKAALYVSAVTAITAGLWLLMIYVIQPS